MAFGYLEPGETPEERRKKRMAAALLQQRGQPSSAAEGAQQGIGSIVQALMAGKTGGQQQQMPFQNKSWAQGIY